MKKRISAYLKQNWVLLLILAAGFALRIVNLTAKNIWYDEACSVNFFQNPWAEIFPHRNMLRPLFFIILKLWTGLFGYSEFALRIPSVFFGVCSILMVYFVPKNIFGRKTGLCSAFLLSVSGYHIIRSQDARGYTLLIFLVLLATNIFWNIINDKKHHYSIYSIIMILMFLMNFFAAFLIFLVHNLFFVFSKKKYKRWLFSQLLILIISASILLPSLKYYYFEQYNDNHCLTEYENVFTNILEDFSYARKINQGGIGYYGTTNISMGRKANYYIIISLFIYSLLGYFSRNRGKKKLVSRKIVFLLLWFFVPLVIFLIVNIFIPISKWSKSAIIILPAFYILIGVILTSLSRKLLIIYFVLYSFFLIFSLSYIFSAPANNAWEQIADHVKKNINEKEMILFAPAHLLAPFWYYYKYEDKLALKEIGDGDCGQFYMADGKWQMEFNDNANLIKGLCFEEIDEMLRKFKPFADNHKGVWLVISPWIGKQNMERIIDMFHRYYTVEWSGKFPWNAVCGYHLIRRE